jgi:hypothetical protein
MPPDLRRARLLPQTLGDLGPGFLPSVAARNIPQG